MADQEKFFLALGTKVRELRKKRGYSQEDMLSPLFMAAVLDYFRGKGLLRLDDGAWLITVPERKCPHCGFANVSPFQRVGSAEILCKQHGKHLK